MTPKHNRVVERKNMSIQKIVRIMLNQNALLKYFCADAVNTAYYVLNRVLIRHTFIKLSISFKKIENSTLAILKFFNVMFHIEY